MLSENKREEKNRELHPVVSDNKLFLWIEELQRGEKKEYSKKFQDFQGNSSLEYKKQTVKIDKLNLYIDLIVFFLYYNLIP